MCALYDTVLLDYVYSIHLTNVYSNSTIVKSINKTEHVAHIIRAKPRGAAVAFTN